MRVAPRTLLRCQGWQAQFVSTLRISTKKRPLHQVRQECSDKETDVLIIGSGAGALTANLRATRSGLKTIMVEKEPTIGGASVLSGGGLWIPCNSIASAAGIRDTEQDAMKYFQAAVGDVGSVSSIEKRQAFIKHAPEMIEFLRDQGFQFHFSKGYPDYYPRMSGAMGERGGRTIESKMFDMRKLDSFWQGKFPRSNVPVPIYTDNAALITRMSSSPTAFAQATVAVLPILLRMATGQKLTSMGRALVAQLLHLNIEGAKLDLSFNTAMKELIQDKSGRVVGAMLQTAEGLSTVKVNRGVILSAGGFARDQHLRKRYMPEPASVDWTLAPAGDMGDAIVEGVRIGAATALLDDAWWGPTIVDPVSGNLHFALLERGRPNCIIVDSSGVRFMNEAQPYTDAGHDQYERNKNVKAIPAWLIMDQQHRDKYMIGTGLYARMRPSQAIRDGRMFVASTLADLAAQIGVNPEGLSNTVERYNQMSLIGKHKDFGKGENVYDNFFGDPSTQPNPNMGPLNRAPFYAIKVWPGDLGTKGGLVTDSYQRVIKEDSKPIEGLYAIGNTAASIMGRVYLGAGSTLGPAMTHGYIAAGHLSSLA